MAKDKKSDNSVTPTDVDPTSVTSIGVTPIRVIPIDVTPIRVIPTPALQPNLKINPNAIRFKKLQKKLSYNEKCLLLAKQSPRFERGKPLPFLPIMIYMIERGIAANKKIPDVGGGVSPAGRLVMTNPILGGIVSPILTNPIFGGRVSPAGRPVGPQPIPMRGKGESDLDAAFNRRFRSIVDPVVREKVLNSLEQVVSRYKSLPQSTKLLFGPPALLTIDPAIKYDSKSFDEFFHWPTPAPPDPPAPKVALKITALSNGIPGQYGANNSFSIIGEGFSANPSSNNIVISKIEKTFPLKGNQEFQKEDLDGVPSIKKTDLSPIGVAKANSTTTRLEATVPDLTPNVGDPHLEYRLRVELTDGTTPAVSKEVPFVIVPNPTKIRSPAIVTAGDPLANNGAPFGGKLVVTARNVGFGEIIPPAGQGVKRGVNTVRVYTHAELVSPIKGRSRILSPSKEGFVDASPGTPGQLMFDLTDNVLPGDYQLQLIARFNESLDITKFPPFVFDGQGGRSPTHSVKILAPRYRVRFTRLMCDEETFEPSPDDEIQAFWGCLFDGDIMFGGSSVYTNVDTRERFEFRMEDGPMFEGGVGQAMEVFCTLFEVDSGDQKTQEAVFSFLSSLGGTSGKLLIVVGQPQAGAVALAAGELFSSLSTLVAAVGNEDDLLGSSSQIMDSALLREKVKEPGSQIGGQFYFKEDGAYDYTVQWEITRLQ